MAITETTRPTDVKQFRGLSTDVKPPNTEFPNVPNGSEFFEIDTGKAAVYDAENSKWWGGTPAPEPNPGPDDPGSNPGPDDGESE